MPKSEIDSDGRDEEGNDNGESSRESEDRSEEEGADEEAGRQEAYREGLTSDAAHAIWRRPRQGTRAEQRTASRSTKTDD